MAVSHPLISRIAAAARLNLIPALWLQGLTAATLLSYYFWPAARAVFEGLMALKLSWGAAYSFLTGALFAGMLPRLVMRWSGTERGPLGAELLFGALFWGYRGVEVDYFYRLQAHWFGDDPTLQVVLCKTLVDQLLYSVFWAVPSIALAYAWKDAGYRWKAMRAHLDREFFTLRLPSVAVGNCMVWLPTVIAIYLLPLPLQLPVANLVSAFWVLLMVVLLRRSGNA